MEHMENMQYAEELVREFLVFRGFKNTLQVYEKELSTDIGKGFQVDKILELIFSVYVPTFEAERLVHLLNFLKHCFSSSSETTSIATLAKLEASILRYYIVHALKSGRKDKVLEFFGTYGNDLLQRGEGWTPWFAIPYVKNPNLEPQFRVYFSKEWFDTLLISFRNLISEIFNGIHILESTVKRLKKDIKQLNLKLSQLQALLETKEAQMCHLRRLALFELLLSESLDILSFQAPVHSFSTYKTCVSAFCSHLFEKQPMHIFFHMNMNASLPANLSAESILPELEHDSSSLEKHSFLDGGATDTCHTYQEELSTDNAHQVQKEEDFPEVKMEFQETFLGHTSPITCCRFSAGGTNIASASVDGTVRIWTYDSSTPTSRNATIYCGAEIMSLDWECKSDRLLLIGTADGCIKAWNVDAKRVVCDLNTTAAFPSVLDLKCSPVEPIFVSAAASKGYTSASEEMGFASLTVWNMKTWKAMTFLPLGKDPPAITSLCFNHNGKLLAAAATDGMIHMFDMSAGLQITGWPAHDSAVSSVQFGPDETSIFSLGSDGKIFEWSLHNQGQVLWSRDCSRFRNSESSNICRHEMALDSNGRRLVVTSDSVRAPIYQVQGHMSGLRTLAHAAAITTVDWHPTLPIYLTGSADHSVRVTSIS
ncbi:hypothetical protein H6P81_014544 [Aristolochia fimbriata]|uniref:WD repeat-containing protein 91 homolog n=1 Tax=Aristolochia fimbriata TaxID=158543 RepID=A0AAV7EJ16_ARIFI|nr:hypothetical protein H6P81_014544 [Aristolochia fimbriata]